MRQRRLKNEINVVPYIDVMLVLLVIFMVTTPMMQTGTVDLPKMGTASTPPQKFIRVQIEAEGGLSIFDTGGHKVRVKDKGQLRETLAGLDGVDEQTPVLISADKSTEYRNVIEVLDEIKQLKYEKVALETSK